MAVKNWFISATSCGGVSREAIMDILNICEATAASREKHPMTLSLLELNAIYNELNRDGQKEIQAALSDIFA